MFKTVFLTIIGFLLLCAIITVSDETVLQKDFHLLPLVQLNILYLLFGVLIQWKRLEHILNQKAIQLNMLFLPALILVVFTLIPAPTWEGLLNVNLPILGFIIKPLIHSDTRPIIGVVSGLLFIRSMDAESEIE